jgi:membrane-associated phospholipid phosphatase
MIFLARSGDINVEVVLAVIAVMILKWERRLRDAFFVSFAVVGVVVLNLLVRSAIEPANLSRWPPQATVFDFGFPSSQAADSLTIALAFVLLTWPTPLRWPTIVFGLVYVLAVALSRICLEWSYLSDIVGGWELSLVWVTASSFVGRIQNKP